MKLVNFLRRISDKPVKYENDFPLKERKLILEMEVKYVQDIIVARDSANLEMSRKEAINIRSDIEPSDSYVQ